MSQSAGTGSPVWFRCWADRRGEGVGHVMNITGRERPYRRKRGSAKGLRSDDVQREYVCSCGHTGWSNHIDLARSAEREAVPVTAAPSPPPPKERPE